MCFETRLAVVVAILAASVDVASLSSPYIGPRSLFWLL